MTSPYPSANKDGMKQRKDLHIDLASKAQVPLREKDPFFRYEPLLAAHPDKDHSPPSFPFLGGSMAGPLWISSMTGGAKKSREINQNLARICAEFSLGMGLGLLPASFGR